jgi:hypothetical protein
VEIRQSAATRQAFSSVLEAFDVAAFAGELQTVGAKDSDVSPVSATPIPTHPAKTTATGAPKVRYRTRNV